jgi:hypothetical protein
MRPCTPRPAFPGVATARVSQTNRTISDAFYPIAVVGQGGSGSGTPTTTAVRLVKPRGSYSLRQPARVNRAYAK